jgi:hypothetical protein
MTEAKFARAEDAKRAGWFSRRHETAEAHKAAQQKRLARSTEIARMARKQRMREVNGG